MPAIFFRSPKNRSKGGREWALIPRKKIGAAAHSRRSVWRKERPSGLRVEDQKEGATTADNHNAGSGWHNRAERDGLEQSDSPARGATGGEHQKDDVAKD